MATKQMFSSTFTDELIAIVQRSGVVYLFQGKEISREQVVRYIDERVKKMNAPSSREFFNRDVQRSARDGVTESYTGRISYDPGVMPLYNGHGVNIDLWTPTSQMNQ